MKKLPNLPTVFARKLNRVLSGKTRPRLNIFNLKEDAGSKMGHWKLRIITSLEAMGPNKTTLSQVWKCARKPVTLI